MPSKLLLACLAVFAILPASAGATNTPELTYPTGTRLATEKSVRGSDIGDLTFTGSNGTVTCTTAFPTGTLTKNNGTELEASLNSFSMTGSGGDGRCKGASSETYVSFLSSCLRSTPEMTEDEFQIRGHSCSEASAPLTVTFATPGECIYERSSPITGTYSTHPEDAVLTVTGAEFTKKSGSLLCATAMKFDDSFTFERSSEGTNPLYLSKGPTLTFPTGTILGTGNAVRAHNISSIKLTSTSGTTLTECTGGSTTGTVTKNTGAEVEIDIESASFTGTDTEEGCAYSFTGGTRWTFGSATNGLPWCLRASASMASDEFQIRGNSCAGESRPIRIIADTQVNSFCIYERKAAIDGTYTTHPEDAKLTFNHTTLLEAEPRKEACADETQMDASFTLERDEAGTHPVYID